VLHTGRTFNTISCKGQRDRETRDSIACIEDDGGDPALVLYKSHDKNSTKRLYPQRLVGVGDVPENDALGFAISVSGRNAVVTSRSTTQMWVISC